MARIPTSAPQAAEPSPEMGLAETGLGLPEAAPESATVLVTVLKTADGSYQVVEGEAPAPMDLDASAEGEAAAGTVGVTVDGVGAALKAVMDILQTDAESEDGLSGQQQFEAGFKGGDMASPSRLDAGKPSAPANPRVTS